MHATLLSTFFGWRTPDWFLDLVRKVESDGTINGRIYFDPCTTDDNPTDARIVYTQRLRTLAVEGESDLGEVLPGCGLDAAWPLSGLGFINPPYGAHLSGEVDPQFEIWKQGAITGYGIGWAKKIAQHRGEHIALVPVRTETQWWQLMHKHSNAVCFWSSPVFGSRISFVDPASGDAVKGSNLASTVFYRGPNVARFARVFREHGTIVPGGLYEWCSI